MDVSNVSVGIPADGFLLPASLTLPAHPEGLVIFAHGAGSGRFSLRNRFVAGVLNAAGFATLLVDLLTHDENDSPSARTDVRLVVARLASATRWAIGRKDVGRLPLGYFGPRIGAPAALWCSAQFGPRVKAVVARGGKADLAAEALRAVRAPVLLLAGEKDPPILQSCTRAYTLLENSQSRKLAVIPGASHLFEEHGALENVALLTRSWFLTHLCQAFATLSNRESTERH